MMKFDGDKKLKSNSIWFPYPNIFLVLTFVMEYWGVRNISNNLLQYYNITSKLKLKYDNNVYYINTLILNYSGTQIILNNKN